MAKSKDQYRFIDYTRTLIKKFKGDLLTVYYVAKDKRASKVIRLMAFVIAAYALSPIDFVPDFIPVIGLLDDLLIFVAGFYVILKFTDDDVIANARTKALTLETKPVSYKAAAAILLIWFLLVCWLMVLFRY